MEGIDQRTGKWDMGKKAIPLRFERPFGFASRQKGCLDLADLMDFIDFVALRPLLIL